MLLKHAVQRPPRVLALPRYQTQPPKQPSNPSQTRLLGSDSMTFDQVRPMLLAPLQQQLLEATLPVHHRGQSGMA